MAIRRGVELLILTLLFSLSLPSYAERKIFLFGFSSTLLSIARSESGYAPEKADFIPVKLTEHSRAWNIWLQDSKTRLPTPQSEIKSKNFINGVIYEIQERELAKIDGLVSWGFERIRIPLHKFRFYLGRDASWFNQNQHEVDIYAFYPWRTDVRDGGPYLAQPSRHREKKVARSLLDVIYAGCTEIDQANNLNGRFLNDCYTTTGLNDVGIKEDRYEPTYKFHPENILKRTKEKTIQTEAFINKEWLELMKQVRSSTGK